MAIKKSELYSSLWASYDELEFFELSVPHTLEEQSAFASVLVGMDTELAEHETQLTATRSIKLGMMQKLLTREIRLI